MKPLIGILVIAVCTTSACTPSQQPSPTGESAPAAQESESINQMDFEEGEIDPGETVEETPVPEPEDGNP